MTDNHDCPWIEEELDERERLELSLTKTFEGEYRCLEVDNEM
jgi:hypothetical protein